MGGRWWAIYCKWKQKVFQRGCTSLAFERGYMCFHSTGLTSSKLIENTRKHSALNSSFLGIHNNYALQQLCNFSHFYYKTANRHGRWWLINLNVLLIKVIFSSSTTSKYPYIWPITVIGVWAILLWCLFLIPDQSRRRNCRCSCCSRAAKRGGGPEAAAAHGCRTLQGEIQRMSATAKTSSKTLWTARGRSHSIPVNMLSTCSQQVKEQNLISVTLCLLITSH